MRVRVAPALIASLAAVFAAANLAFAAATPHFGSPAAIPGTIRAADFDDGGEGVGYHDTTPVNQGGAYRDAGVDIEVCSEGGFDVGWIAAGEWMQYTVNVAAAGSYQITFRVAASGQGGRFHLEMDGANVSGTLTIPDTGGWQNWQTVTVTATLAAGQHAARFVADAAGANSVGNVEWMRFTAAGPAATPHLGSPAAIPGQIRAADFDDGGEGVAYHDTTAVNEGGAYRATGVDIENCSEGGVDVGWVAAGEWLQYTVTVATAGTYRIDFRVASAGQGGKFHLEVGGSNVTGTLTVPDTGGWQRWQTISATASLAAGQQTARLVMESAVSAAVGNFEWMQFTTNAPVATPYGASAAAIPGTIQIEDFDKGGEGVAYHDATAGNAGGAYRQTDVDIENAAGGGYDVGWVSAGEWLQYTVNVASSGVYTARFRVAALGPGGAFHLEVGGSDVTGRLTVPNTGGWQTWQTVSVGLTLTAGRQTARLVMDTNGANAVGNFDWMDFAPGVPAPPPPVGNVIPVPPGGDLQGAIDAAQPGDTIVLTPGATYTGGLVLRAKAGNAYITIRSAAPDASLPADGVRIGPQQASLLPKIQGGIAGVPAFLTAPGAHHWRLLFLEMVNTYPDNSILDLGDGSSAQSSLGVVPHDLIVDRCFIHGSANYGQKRGIALNSASTSVVNSYISDIKSGNEDAQAINGWNGPGPFTIVNNYLEASGENFLLGGADPWIPNLVPSDITFQRNYVTKQVSWRNESWTVKNLIELKNAQRVVIDGNVIENNWLAAQSGYSIVLTPRNQEGRAPWSTVQHVQFTNNVVRHVSAGFNILGTDNIYPSQPLTDVVIRNNLFLDVSGARWGGSGRVILTQGGSNITIDHNTMFTDGTSILYADVTTVSQFTFTNNIGPDNAWAIMGGGQGPGNPSIAAYYPGGTFLDNVIIGSNAAIYPRNNFYPATIGAVGFVDPASNFRLSPTSPYRTAATDASAVGCNIDALNAAAATQY